MNNKQIYYVFIVNYKNDPPPFSDSGPHLPEQARRRYDI